MLHNLAIVGEACKQLSDELKATAGNVPWRQITGMRDKLIHHYVDLELVWRTASEVVPTFRDRACKLMQRITPDG